jgi:hypothetical protein
MIKVSILKSHNCFFFGLKRSPKPTTAVMIMVTKTDNKWEDEMALNKEPSR